MNYRRAVLAIMRDGQPRTVAEIEAAVLGREASPHEHFILGGVVPSLAMAFQMHNGEYQFRPGWQAEHSGGCWVYRFGVQCVDAVPDAV